MRGLYLVRDPHSVNNKIRTLTPLVCGNRHEPFLILSCSLSTTLAHHFIKAGTYFSGYR